MLNESQNVLPLEHDFQALCAALERTPQEQRPTLLAKLALVLCERIQDKSIVRSAIERVSLNLD